MAGWGCVVFHQPYFPDPIRAGMDYFGMGPGGIRSCLLIPSFASSRVALCWRWPALSRFCPPGVEPSSLRISPARDDSNLELVSLRLWIANCLALWRGEALSGWGALHL